MDLQGNLSWILGFLGAGIGTVLAYFQQYQFLGTLLGIVIGAGIAYFVQNRTQKRTWKREYAVRLAEEVYGVLYKELKWIVFFLKKTEINQLNFESWGRIQEEYRYFMVDEEFSQKLDQFFQRVRDYNEVIYKLKERILPKIIDEAGLDIFGTHIDRMVPRVKFKDVNSVQTETPNFIDCLLSSNHPTDYVVKHYPEAKFLEFDFSFGTVPASEHDIKKFDQYWKLCLEKKNENETYKFVKDESERLLTEASKLEKEITRRIREPWNI